ncbi:unnamed protein product [Rangifer tarandus platyrhynchus]|uniref:Uncharacterized protein n=2 Tax=Rangifer tarandus platyrhynchus TaxID=3082113 RepID=A0ABN8ZAM0_RANTA|nr:unnamed protein product [Rangifer tarandus platyrhynchus]
MMASLRNNSHPHSLFPNKQQAQVSVLPPPTKRAAAMPSCHKAAAFPALYPSPHCSLEVRGSCPHVGRGVVGRRPVGGIPAARVGASTAFFFPPAESEMNPQCVATLGRGPQRTFSKFGNRNATI